MPNNAYLRSTKRERELVNQYRRNGWHSCRSAGSHSQWDVWAYNPADGAVELTQIKTKKGARGFTDKILEERIGRVKLVWRSFP